MSAQSAPLTARNSVGDTRDPIEYADGASLYAYVRASPLLLRDPLGLHPGGWRGNGLMSNDSTDDTPVVVDGRNKGENPDDIACVEPGKNSKEKGVKDADDVYVKVGDNWCKYRVYDHQEGRVIGWGGHFERRGYLLYHPGDWKHPEPEECYPPGHDTHKLLEQAIKNCKEGKPPLGK